jgi:hypothetical protein
LDLPVSLGRKGIPRLACPWLPSGSLSTPLPKPGVRRGGPPSRNAAKSQTRPFLPPNGSSPLLRLSPRLTPRTMCSLFTGCAGGSSWLSSGLRA